MGGQQSVLNAIAQSLQQNDFQWAVELTDLLLTSNDNLLLAKQYNAQGLLALAKQETSANSRHYYIAAAKALL